MASRYQRFLFDDLDIRGASVRLTDTWQSLLAGRDYPEPVVRLLGAMSAVGTLLAGERKQPGRLSFQARGDGPIRLLVIDCDEQLRLRGMAKVGDPRPTGAADTPAELLGNGQLVMTLELPEAKQPFQSIVPLVGDTVGAIFEHFLTQSQQQDSRIVVAADRSSAAAIFLQKLPDADRRDPDGWNRILHLIGTLTSAELLQSTSEDLLTRVFPEETVRVFTPRAVVHHCPREPERVRAALRSLGRPALESMLAEHGEIVVTEDMCNHTYRFDAVDVAALFDTTDGSRHAGNPDDSDDSDDSAPDPQRPSDAAPTRH